MRCGRATESESVNTSISLLRSTCSARLGTLLRLDFSLEHLFTANKRRVKTANSHEATGGKPRR